jgi:hypothetical protein
MTVHMPCLVGRKRIICMIDFEESYLATQNDLTNVFQAQMRGHLQRSLATSQSMPRSKPGQRNRQDSERRLPPSTAARCMREMPQSRIEIGEESHRVQGIFFAER